MLPNRLEEDGKEWVPGGAELTRNMESSFLVVGLKVTEACEDLVEDLF